MIYDFRHFRMTISAHHTDKAPQETFLAWKMSVRRGKFGPWKGSSVLPRLLTLMTIDLFVFLEFPNVINYFQIIGRKIHKKDSKIIKSRKFCELLFPVKKKVFFF